MMCTKSLRSGIIPHYEAIFFHARTENTKRDEVGDTF